MKLTEVHPNVNLLMSKSFNFIVEQLTVVAKEIKWVTRKSKELINHLFPLSHPLLVVSFYKRHPMLAFVLFTTRNIKKPFTFYTIIHRKTLIT
jgi:hypothetical protein